MVPGDKDIPIACALTPGEIRDRRSSLLPGLVANAEAIEDTPTGYVLRFAPTNDTLRVIAEAIDAERHCCPFLEFHLLVPSQHGSVTLTVTGPTGAREFLTTLLTL